MPLPGGAADKLGNRFETSWTISQLIYVMNEQAQSLRIEPPGSEGEGVEFVLCYPGRTEYHQVKRQQSKSDRWSLAALNGVGVLAVFAHKLWDDSCYCCFASMQDASELRELAEAARGSMDFDEFKSEFLKARDRRISFSQLHGYWSYDSEPQTWDALRKVEVVGITEQILRRQTETLLASLVEGEPCLIFEALAGLCADSIHKELTPHDIWSHLQARRFRRRAWSKDASILAAVADQTDHHCQVARMLPIAGSFEVRIEACEALGQVTRETGKRLLLLKGIAGSGKSVVAADLIGAVRSQGWPVLAFRVDRLGPTPQPGEVGKQLHLPDSPAVVLGAMAAEQDCLLLIDQLDAVSLASGRHPDFFDCIFTMVQQVSAFPRMRVALVCREFDVEHDHRIREMCRPEICHSVKIDQFSPETVDRILDRLGVSSLSLKQKEVLRLPQCLLLLSQIVRAPGTRMLSFATSNDLYEEFWNVKEAAVRVRCGGSSCWVQIIDLLCQQMSKSQSLSVAKAALDQFPADVGAMTSEHVLVLDNGRHSFFHETFFDYCFARRFVGQGQTIQALLTGDDQHLFRRAQVRQILVYQRANSRNEYLRDLEWLLNSSDVRAHLKQVVRALLATIEDPSKEEWAIASGMTRGLANE